VVLVVRRPPLDKAVVLLAAVPIAVIANVTRITATGLAQEWGSPELADRLFHDWAGWLMMPLALGLLWLLLRALDWALIAAPERRPVTAVPVPAGLAFPPHRPKGRRGRRR
jgi:exosortase/archaeosortase family protein